jgi:hypothetical protein
MAVLLARWGDLQLGRAKTLPDPMATETDIVVRGFAVNARFNPGGLPATWHIEYGATAAYGSSTTPRKLPGKLTAHYRETWGAGSLAGFNGSINRNRLTWEGGFVRYTAEGNSGGDDPNHVSGIGWIQLPLYFYCGSYDPLDAPMARLGGGDPDFRGARQSMRVRGNAWVKAGTRLCTWIQVDRDTTRTYPVGGIIDRPNWCHTAKDLTETVEAGDWRVVGWTLHNRTSEWTYGGRNDEHPAQRYWYGELDKSLSNVNLDIFPLQNIDIRWAVEYPSGSIDFDWWQIDYRQHNLCAASNGGTLISQPAGGTGAEYLADGWRNEAAGGPGDWLSAANPTSPQDFVFAFADPVEIKKFMVHNSLAYPSRDIEVAVSADGGDTWTTIRTGTLPQSSEHGPNFAHYYAEQKDIATVFIPLHAGTVNRLRVRVTSGYGEERWGLGEIEAFGTGATEQTEDGWYDLNQDIEVAAGTYHYRAVMTTSEGVTYGPDQVVVVS